MAGWANETREFTEHRWILRQPVHPNDLTAALGAANRKWIGVEPSERSDITVRGEDDYIVVAFTAPRVTGKRESLAELFAPVEDDE